MPKTHDKAMENLDQKLEAKQEAIKKAEKDLKHAKKVTSKLCCTIPIPYIPFSIQVKESPQYVTTQSIATSSPSFHLQAAKNGGDRADHDKKKKAVQKWVFISILSLFLLTCNGSPEHPFFWICWSNLFLRLLEQLEKLEIQKTDKHENKVTLKKNPFWS